MRASVTAILPGEQARSSSLPGADRVIRGLGGRSMSIRFKLTTIAVAVILIANSLLSFLSLQYLSHVWLGEVQKRVQRNLSAARAAYDQQVKRIAAYLQGTAIDPTLSAALSDASRPGFQTRLQRICSFGEMDFVGLLDLKGKVLCRAQSPQHGDDLSTDPLFIRALHERRPVTGTLVYTRERLLAEGGELAERARVPVIPTAAGRPTADAVRTEGMVIGAAVPVCDAQGQVQAILYGGDLLNNRHEIVDAFKSQVFPNESYQGKDIGTVTIFLRDLRISTNVFLDDGRRAVGTLLSETVCAEVLDRGGTWAAPAFVVNDWYLTAYEPIRDPAGQIIGVLYVGLLRAPFAHQRDVTVGVFLAMVLAATVASLVLLFVAYELVLGPIRRVVAMAQRVIGGDLTARVGIRPPGEIGMLCRAIDSMTHAVAEREELLKLATRQQLSRSEQLASVGRLAAGVAHEINNPLVGVLAFADMMREKENLDDQDRQDLELIIRETKRVREIVRGLLDFARETPSVRTRVDVNDVMRQTVRLLGKREAFEKIYIVEDLSEPLPPVDFDKSQLQQVFLNLALNACEAMPDGGTLMLHTSATADRVVATVTDTGCGIKREHLDQIFEPFFTTKPVGKGTGLGLSVSYGIVHQHGGTLDVESEVGKGTTFTVTLPAVPTEPDDPVPKPP
jgi:two-component system NtrC family sensor kinase